MSASTIFKSSKYLLMAAAVLALTACSSEDLTPVHAAGPTGVKNVLLVHGALGWRHELE